jgi:hypothetical protein
MLRRLAAVSFVAFAVSSGVALADGGPGPGVVSGGGGVLSANGLVRYVTVGTQNVTTLEAVSTHTGRVLRSANVAGSWGIPAVAYDGTAGGLSRNNATLVLQQANPLGPLNGRSQFQIVDPKAMDSYVISLKGTFTYDALSPDGRTLYLIDHVSASNGSAYQVRAYDVASQRLLPRVIADRTQRGWVMQGTPVARTQSPNDRFVYTLYQNYGGTPFVHELDTVRGVAHCIGVPYTSDQNGLMGATITLRRGGRQLAIAVKSGTSLARLDVATYRASAPVAVESAGFAWWWLGLPAAVVLVLAFGFATRRPRRRAVPA